MAEREARVRPADFPPPFAAGEFVTEPTDPVDERIEVGVLIVGAGPAGLACAIRLGQLLEEDPTTRERLGEVPVAVLEKGKQPGSQLLSGAVVNPRSLRALFRGRRTIGDMPFYGPVENEAVYFLTGGSALRIPTPPTMKNHHNHVASLSELGRWLAGEAEALGAMILPETAAERLLVQDGRVRGVRTGDKGRGRNGEPLATFEPGSDVTSRVTVLAEGTQGHLTGVAIDRFGLEGESPQVWALGVKEVWQVAKPLDRVIHTMGWPLRLGKKYREFGGSFIYPMGDDLVTLGMVVGLDYRDAELSVHDLLQELKTHKLVRKILAGGERVAWGAKTIPEGGLLSVPRQLHAPGLLLVGDGAGLVNVPALKGIHYAVESGRLAAEAAYAALQRGSTPARALRVYDDSLRDSFVWKDLREVRNMRPAFARGFWMGGALAGAMTASKGHFPPKDAHLERDIEQSLVRTGRAAAYPAPDGRLTFDKLSSVYASGNRTRDDQPNHIRIRERVPRDLADLWVNMCPAQVYGVAEADGDDTVRVEVTPSNCVQCGAITAKGGRLTPPEGGSGPEYTRT
jgi:electron-transferring-flavoprotein dehydrogenase